MMNTNVLSGKWDQLKGKVKQQWAKLTDDDLTAIDGKREEIIGKIKERYGYTEEQAKTEVDKFMQNQQ